MKKWGQRGVLICTAGMCALAVLCVAMRMPDVSGGTALAAAGFALPGGAVEAMRHGYEEPVPPSSQVPLPTVSKPKSSSTAPAASWEEQEAFAPDETEFDLPAPDNTVSAVVANGVKEMTVANTGVEYNGVWVRNSNKNHGIDIAAELDKQPAVKMKRDGSVEILLYHTHTTEAYAGSSRTTDNSKNMVAVGEVIANQLRAAGFGVVHDTTCHDYPAYSGSYNRSAETIARNLKKYPGIQVTLDIHRDAMTASDGSKLKPTVVINGKKAAQMMIISGCDDNGTLGHPNWEYNLRLAVRLQKSVTDLYPGLARPLNFSNSKYNEHMTKGSLLVEFGTEVNTLDEAKYSGDLFATSLAQALSKLTSSAGGVDPQ